MPEGKITIKIKGKKMQGVERALDRLLNLLAAEDPDFEDGVAHFTYTIDRPMRKK